MQPVSWCDDPKTSQQFCWTVGRPSASIGAPPMQIIRVALIALVAGTVAGCHTPPRHAAQPAAPAAHGSVLTRNQLAEIFADRRSKGAMVSVRATSPTEYAIDFATPSPPITGTQYRYESFTIRKTDLDPTLAAEIGRVSIRPSGPGG